MKSFPTSCSCTSILSLQLYSRLQIQYFSFPAQILYARIYQTMTLARLKAYKHRRCLGHDRTQGSGLRNTVHTSHACSHFLLRCKSARENFLSELSRRPFQHFLSCCQIYPQISWWAAHVAAVLREQYLRSITSSVAPSPGLVFVSPAAHRACERK